jgi:hypothetical protein
MQLHRTATRRPDALARNQLADTFHNPERKPDQLQEDH